ncbi:hypothetical protein GGS24DRAFT_460819 [Hypoxylon argillaceum]|nr:hypothetical protein GGS24DRAFT_460819 [Hypoxylon argillaceum]
MGPVLRLVARIAEDGRMSYGFRDTSEHDFNDSNNGDDGHAETVHNSGLPWWAILITVYASIIFLVFLASFIYYWKREQERRKAGEQFRPGHAVWKAFSAATGLWVWSWVFKNHGWCGSDRKKDGAAGAGPYQQIDARRTLGARGAPSPAPSSSTGTQPTRTNTPAQYGSQTNQNPAYVPYGQSKTMSKSPGYKPTYDAFEEQGSIPMGILHPHSNPNHPPPPPYISSPPPVELDGRSIELQRNDRVH